MINIEKHSETACFGYIFRLEERSTYEGCIKLDVKTTAVLVENSYYIYLNLHSTIGASAPLEQQFEKLQKILDYLSLRGIQNSSVKVPFGHYFSWQLINGGYSLKLTKSSISQCSSTVGDISKLEVEHYHEGFRFFRFAQIAHDLYDSYRNLWLAFESLITTYTPRNKNESELSWYSRALGELEQKAKDNDLHNLLQKKSIEMLMRELYKDTRSLLFHSKDGEIKLIPHKIEEYERVKLSLTELTIIVSAILKHHHSIRSKSSWMNPDLFIDGYKDLFKDVRLFVTDYAEEKGLDTDKFLELQENVVPDTVIHQIIKKDSHVEHRFTSNIAVKNIKSKTVRRFSFADENKELIVSTLDEELSLDGISCLEIDSILGISFIERPRSYNYRI